MNDKIWLNQSWVDPHLLGVRRPFEWCVLSGVCRIDKPVDGYSMKEAVDLWLALLLLLFCCLYVLLLPVPVLIMYLELLIWPWSAPLTLVERWLFDWMEFLLGDESLFLQSFKTATYSFSLLVYLSNWFFSLARRVLKLYFWSSASTNCPFAYYRSCLYQAACIATYLFLWYSFKRLSLSFYIYLYSFSYRSLTWERDFSFELILPIRFSLILHHLFFYSSLAAAILSSTWSNLSFSYLISSCN